MMQKLYDDVVPLFKEVLVAIDAGAIDTFLKRDQRDNRAILGAGK